MKLGNQTASLVNYCMASSGQPKPEIGMPATLCGWTDRYPATVVNVSKDMIMVQEDKYRLTGGSIMSESQEYEYERNPAGSTYHFKLDRNGKWNEVRLNKETNRWCKTNGKGIVLGTRERYYDPSF